MPHKQPYNVGAALDATDGTVRIHKRMRCSVVEKKPAKLRPAVSSCLYVHIYIHTYMNYMNTYIHTYRHTYISVYLHMHMYKVSSVCVCLCAVIMSMKTPKYTAGFGL